MSLGKQAKTLSRGQAEAIFRYLMKTRYPIRNQAIFLLSLKAGLRAKEVASLTWEMIIDANGEVGQAIHLQDQASKGRSGRNIPMNGDVRSALGAGGCRARDCANGEHLGCLNAGSRKPEADRRPAIAPRQFEAPRQRLQALPHAC
ncbi:site-specific integrase [Tardiphaga sp. vice352]|uniref:tyrosine-type recombinase/integrase n=1 Tax=unclassified Tardiphaga TaxID=2631404 RepID=UPI0011636819|nr:MULTISPECIES: tyrosine-type recombinase/integrase [unclassified Tardiphaga]QDM19165.1 site-specific integrase [Tardiphaga sp. vice278]QDM29373.1 site-specific integrase [Tardiphaga sp. vice304]QDM34472.1 site-specific integrase [Tardiphaga sp. vice352]